MFWKKQDPQRNGHEGSHLFEEDRARLLDQIDRMGEGVRNSLRKAIRSLVERDLFLAKEVIAGDDEIDLMELEIERECLRIIALRRPVREELRFVFAILKVITDLERMADQSVNIAEQVIDLGTDPLLKPLIDIPRMAQICEDMLNDALDALRYGDIQKAKAVMERDDEVDALDRSIFTEMIEILESGKAPLTAGIKGATDLMLISRHLERVGDHASNIAERSYFMVTGSRLREERREKGTNPV